MATQLSGGQQQRLALARALVRRPKLLLLDEPLSNLDAKLREDMRFEVRELQRRLGVTTLYVTHDQVEALSMSSRIAVMESGRIVQEGTPREIYQQPRTAFVANFVGATNFVDAVVITSALSGGVSELQTALGEQPVRAVCPSGTLSGEKVSLAVRPENIHVHVGDQPPADSPNLFRGRVQKALFVGDYLETNILVGSVTLTTRPHPTVRVRTGDTVFVAFPIELCAVLSDTRGVAAAAYGQGDDLTSPIEPSRRP
jgi:iron(III) transport system ATP-binding protein